MEQKRIVDITRSPHVHNESFQFYDVMNLC